MELLYEVETPIGGNCFAAESVAELDIVEVEVAELDVVDTIMLIVAMIEGDTDGLGCVSSGTGII